MIPFLYFIDLLNQFTACNFFRIRKFELESFLFIFQHKQKLHVEFKFFIQTTIFCRKGNIKTRVNRATFFAGLPIFHSKDFYIGFAAFEFKGAVTIYRGGGLGLVFSENHRALKFCPPSTLCTEILSPLNSVHSNFVAHPQLCVLKFCPPSNTKKV